MSTSPIQASSTIIAATPKKHLEIYNSSQKKYSFELEKIVSSTIFRVESTFFGL
jgi:hypothetical protein